MKKFAIAVFVLCALAVPALAAQDNFIFQNNREDIERIEAYLNTIRSLRANFVQASSNGNSAEGKLYLQRPNRLRFAYAAPSPIELIADGKNLVYYDSRLQQVTYMSVVNSPLAPILQDRVDFDEGTVTLTRFTKRHGEMNLTFIKKNDPSSGEVTLQFQQEPVQLRRWIIRDAQDIITTVSLLDMEIGADIDPKMFVFNDPRPLNLRNE